MFHSRRHREIPELNTTSTADISFMLLVFFLVTSSMDADRGLMRRLPPDDGPKKELKDISRSNVLLIRIDADDRLYCDDKPATGNELQRQVLSFVASRQTADYVIAVDAHPQSTYNAYFEMQNTVMAAYRQWRDITAQRLCNKPFSQCTREQQETVMARCPQRISEAVVKEGGNR